eukprot:TRINITY_DN28075_c0_g1_i1.p1 TRINITY_DN28075_c0_g1~~TRINITY_DN28075_c0_g1_i1.p1  ORF type:complete len:4655 (+),score=704.17 TRINITY_DN28075_c0_g1_i1:659-13966(+)
MINGPSIYRHQLTSRTRLALTGGGRAQCSCPKVSGNVAGTSSLLRLAVSGVLSGRTFQINFVRPPVSLHSWAVPMPYSPLSTLEVSLQVVHQFGGAGGGSNFPIFGGGDEFELPAGASCAVGNYAGEVVYGQRHIDKQPNLMLGSSWSVASCQLPTMPLVSQDGTWTEIVYASADGIRWSTIGKIDVSAPPFITGLTNLKDQISVDAAIGLTGEGFVPGCQCVFTFDEGVAGWDATVALVNTESRTISEYARVVSDTFLRCSVPNTLTAAAAGKSIAVAALCPPGHSSSNYLWWHAPQVPLLTKVQSLNLRRGSAKQTVLFRGNNFLASRPLYCANSQDPSGKTLAVPLTDALAACVFSSGPRRGIADLDVAAPPLEVYLSNAWGDKTISVPIPIDEPLDIHNITGLPLSATSGGGTLGLEGLNLPINGLWCRIGDLHVPALVDPYSYQRKASCIVPPSIPANVTVQAVSTSTGTASGLFNMTYRERARILQVSPRLHLPYRQTLTKQKYWLDLHGTGFVTASDCVVRFGEVEAPQTMVMSPTLVQTVVPAMTSNVTLPIHLFCGAERLQQTEMQTLRFRFEHLPEVHGVEPDVVEAQARQWVMLRGRHFEDSPGRACMIGSYIVDKDDVRWMSPRTVQCRIPVLTQELQDMYIAYSSDGIHFSSDKVKLRTRVRVRTLSVKPSKVFVGEPVKLIVRGRNFLPELQCLFDERLRVSPVFIERELLVCDMPGSFRQVGQAVKLRLVIANYTGRDSEYAIDEKEFSVRLYRRPIFGTVHPLFGTPAGGTPLVITGRYLNFDANVSCIFDGSLPSPAEVTRTEIRCLSNPPLSHYPEQKTNISIRYFDAEPFTVLKTGLHFRFEHPPVLSAVQPPFLWIGKVLRISGSNFNQALPMYCRFKALEDFALGAELRVLAEVESASELSCVVPQRMDHGPAELSVTNNDVEWSEPLTIFVYGAQRPSPVIPYPRHVAGYGNESVRMELPAPPRLAGIGGPCVDDESYWCLAPRGEAPQSCNDYVNAGLCGKLQYDECCRHSCGFCAAQLIALGPPNLACLLNSESLQPFSRQQPSPDGKLVWTCSLPPLDAGFHKLELVLMSDEYRFAYPRLEAPELNSKRMASVAVATIESWGGLGVPDVHKRDNWPRFAYAEGGVYITIKGVNASMVRDCHFGEGALSRRSPDMATGYCETWCMTDATYAPPYCCGPRPSLEGPAIFINEQTVMCQVQQLPLLADGMLKRNNTREPLMDPILPLSLGMDGSPGTPRSWWPSGLSVGTHRTFATISVAPQRGPLEGIEVTVRTDGVGVPPHARCRCRFGMTQVLGNCLAKLQAIRCMAPPVLRSQTVPLQFSVNDGMHWSSPAVEFSYYAQPLFGAFHPPLGLLLGVNNVTLLGSQFPADSNVSAYCRWQGVYIVPAHVRAQDRLDCLVPSHSKFASFDREGDDMPLTLEVSFAGLPPVWIPAHRSLSFRQHQQPVRQTQRLFVAPRHGIASVGGALLTLTGTDFLYPVVNASLVNCVFGRVFLVPAVVYSSTTIRCRAPPLHSVYPNAEPPVDVTIDLTFDGGQTLTHLQNVYSYLKDFEFSSVSPSGGLFDTLTTAEVKGKHFFRTPNLFLKFGDMKSSVQLFSSKRLRSIAPKQPSGGGVYPILYSVDDQTFVKTGLNWTATETSLLREIHPDRGFRTGGTNVSIIADSIEWTPSLSCVFGYALASVVPVQDPEEPLKPPKLTCLTPPCKKAMYADGIGPTNDPDFDCFGFVAVQLTFNGQNKFGNLTYEYVRMPQVKYASPFPASGYNNPITIGLYGENFKAPMWCRWWDLEYSMATDIAVDFMRCLVPPLPKDRRPDLDVADNVLSYLEISPNAQDWTRYRRAWMWYQEPEVDDIEPNTTFRTYAPGSDFIIRGNYFRLLQLDLVQCVWLYDAYLPPEYVQAELLAPDVMRCQPRLPVAESGVGTDKLQPLGANLEVSMSTQVQSESGLSVLAEDRMELAASREGPFPGPAVFPSECLLTGGCTITLRGERLWAEDPVYGSGNRTGAKLFVSIGDHLLEARRGKDPNHATIRLPPVPHMAPVPRAESLQLTRNLQDLTPALFGIAYEPIPIGSFYRPELHNGTLQTCPKGNFCPGAGSNQSEWIFPGEAPQPCLPGTWLKDGGYHECDICPEGVVCDRPGMYEPEHCKTGLVCWGQEGMDANLALCPSGTICVRPPYGKTPSTAEPLFRRLRDEDARRQKEEENTSRRLRLTYIPAGVTQLPCPAGYFCPPGSIAQEEADGSISYLTPMKCTKPGIVCAEGAFNPLMTDVVAAPGQYVAADGSGVLPCPVGMYCPGGPGSLLPIPCPPGQYQVSAGAPSCATCTAGTVCSGFGGVLPELCPAGRVCAHPGRRIPSYTCPQGSYCPPGVITLNTQSGLPNSPKVCPPGTYCMAGSASGIINDTSTSSAKSCTEGTFCGANSTTAGGTDNCPPRWYCPRGVNVPQPTPPGHFVGKSGSIYPSKCRPGTYAANWLMIACDPCPPGTECPLDGTIVPTVCRAGTYREATLQGADPTKNVMCIPCPQGTWSALGGLTSVLDCQNCDERYVCSLEGTVRFATVDNPCRPGARPTDICYENSQGWDCPQGYGCGPATTSFTQYDNYCEAGFWCKVRTIPSETRNLLCPAGYYCKRETGESGGSGRKAFRCPSNHFCPLGTAAVDERVDNQPVIKLHNVQARIEIVTAPDLSRGSMCRICSDELPAGVFRIEECKPCGKPVPLSTFEDPIVFDRRLQEIGDEPQRYQGDARLPIQNWVYPHENFSETERGVQVIILPADYVEEPVDLDEELGVTPWSEAQAPPPKVRFEVAEPPEVVKVDSIPLVAEALKDWDLPDPVVGTFAPSRFLQDEGDSTQADLNMSNSSNGSNVTEEVIYHCAPDVQTEELVPWTKESGKPCYYLVKAWKGALKCPRGTISTIGSDAPEDCIQQGQLIAIQNIYKCYPPRPCAEGNFPADYQCKPEEVLCGISEPLETLKSDKTFKKSYLWGDLIDLNDPGRGRVRFFGFDPEFDEDLIVKRPFYNFSLEPLDVALLDFDFSLVDPSTLVNAGQAGHFNIHIHSDTLPANDLIGHTLPPFFWLPANTDLHVPIQLKILALEKFNMSVQLDLLHGGHLENLRTLHQTLNIRKYSPSRTDWGTRNVFYAVVSKELLLSGAYELPYNMPPGTAGQSGEPQLAIDLTVTSGLANLPQSDAYFGKLGLKETARPGQAFWSSAGVETVTFPWIPFFSNCDTFDSHIHLWDLFESPGVSRPGCELVDLEDVLIVPEAVLDFATMELRVEPVADACEFIVKCEYEETLEEGTYSSTLWWELEGEVELFYVTAFPTPYEEFAQGDAYFSGQIGLDSLCGVGYEADDRQDMRIPRRVVFSIAYFQITPKLKKIVSVDMKLGEFDDNIDDSVYYLMVELQAMNWNDLMNNFQLSYQIYCALYVILGLGAVGASLAAWIAIRLKVRKATAPPFRLAECYEFLLYWPTQGVTFATAPAFVACGVIKVMFLPSVDFIQGIPCTWASASTGQSDEKEAQRCANGRTGICFMLVGTFMMMSGSRMLIPRLRLAEEQFLLQQPTHLLSKEGLTLRAEQKDKIKVVPIRWKRAHLIFLSIFLIFPLTILWEMTYCDFFGENALTYIVGFSFAMDYIDNALSKAVREELVQVPLSTACGVVLFIGTLGADDFMDFCEGYFIELIIGIAQRLLLGTLLEMASDAISSTKHWMKTRSWFWRAALRLSGSPDMNLLMTEAAEDEGQEEAEAMEEEEAEGTPIEEAIEEVIGCGTACMSTIVSPYLIILIMIFAGETQIPMSYGIRINDLVCYLLFGFMICPFQVMMDTLMNHATELSQGVRIYDYMLYSKWRWRNRVTRWLFDDPRLDQSVAEPLQSINHLAFSPQFYFVETYYTWGLILAVMSFTIVLRHNMNPLDDPALIILAFEMVALNSLLDRFIRWLTSSVLWKPADNTNFRIFSRSIAVALKHKDAAAETEKYRQWFWQRHSGWIINNMNEIFTPRSREKYKTKLSILYQNALSLQPTRFYKVPGPAFPEPVGQQELPENLRLELEEEESDDDDPGSPLPVTSSPTAGAPRPSEAPNRGSLMGGPGGRGSIQAPSVPALPDRSSVGATSALGDLELPRLPDLPAPPAPPQAALTWPLHYDTDGDNEGMPAAAAGFGPLAALTGKAWLATARRRLEMLKYAQEYRNEQPVADVCAQCAVRARDPFVMERIGVWKDGVRFKVYLTKNVRELAIGFEQHYHVPRMPLVLAHWQSWLNQKSSYQTLCVRCALERGFDPPPPEKSKKKRRDAEAIEAGPQPLQLADSPQRPVRPAAADHFTDDESDEDSPARPSGAAGSASDAAPPPDAAQEDGAESEQSDHSDDLELNPTEIKRFPNLVDVSVSTSSREMIIYWAKQARRQLKHRRVAPPQESEDENEQQDDDDDFGE